MRNRLIHSSKDSVYHVICRTAYQINKLSDESKSVFTALLRKQAAFAGVEVITYCLLDNHVHLLIKIPYRKKIEDKELVGRYLALYGEEGTEYALPPELLEKKLSAGGKEAEALRARLMARMQNLSIFVKELKQRFGIWFNRRHQNSGTLWSDRFHSVLVENNNEAIAYVSAYIELNPVRLGKCTEPTAYKFSNIKNNKCYGLLKQNHPLKTYLSARPQSDNDALGIPLNQTIHEMSHGRLIGSSAFIESHCAAHQKTLKRKSKWMRSVVLNVLCACSSLLDFHVHKKPSYPDASDAFLE